MILTSCLWFALAAFQDPPQGETLYNGIRLPAVWPPKSGALPKDPEVPPYLKSPPAVIWCFSPPTMIRSWFNTPALFPPRPEKASAKRRP